jgi:hypothetical protein
MPERAMPLTLIQYNEVTLIHVITRHDSRRNSKKNTMINGDFSHEDIYLNHLEQNRITENENA